MKTQLCILFAKNRGRRAGSDFFFFQILSILITFYDTQSTIVLVNKDFVPEQEVKATLIKVDNAYESLAKLLTLYEMSKPKKDWYRSAGIRCPHCEVGEGCIYRSVCLRRRWC